MHYIKFLLIIILYGAAFSGYSQERDLKAMIEEEKAGKNDTLHVNLLITICDSLYRTKPSETISFGSKALDLSTDLNFRKGEAYALKFIGMGYFVKGEYVTAIEFFERSMAVFEAINYRKGVANMLSNIGVIYNNGGDDIKAAEFYLRSLKISEEINDSVRVLTALTNIGLIYSKKEDTWDQAEDNYLKALKISKKLGYLDAIGTLTVNLGELLFNKGEYKEALRYYEDGLKTYQKTNSGNIPYTLIGIGKIYSRWEDYPNAIKYQKEALDIAVKNSSKLEMGQALLELAKTYRQRGDMKEAIDYFKQAEKIASEIGAKYELKEIFGGIASVLADNMDYDEAYRYQLMESNMKDSLFSETSQLQISQLFARYQLESMLKENEILKRDVSLRQAKSRQQAIIIFFLVLGFFSICIFLFYIARANIQKKKANEALNKANGELNTALATVNHQKKEIEEAHEEITASIRYAKYIQSSVLPKPEQMACSLGEYFILHKPKDIVSGDFYWVSHSGGKTIVAVADCTGHGVPGAFMSMLGMTLLNEIVNKDSVTVPGTILNRLRAEVTRSLKQKGERLEQKDGMDITICTIDRENMKLQFAGAINPMYIIRKAGFENAGIVHSESADGVMLLEMKGDTMPIGIVDDMENFRTHEISIFPGDSFYMFSDGLADQFGGPNHKKFSYRRLRESLVKTNHGAMTDQKTGMENVMNEWIGNNNQTDDMLMVGFRIN